MELVRSFIAIELPEELRAALKQLQDTLRRDIPKAVKWAEPDRIHLTLKFLGGVPSERLDDILGAIKESAQGIAPFRLETDVTGAFPSLKRPRVVWVGVRGDIETLRELQQRIESACVRLGFTEEGRFSPHLTLGRVRPTASIDDIRCLGEVIAGARLNQAYAIPVSAVNLMKSQLTPAGAIYSRLAAVELAA